MKRYILSLALTTLWTLSWAGSPQIDLCGEKVDYRLIEQMNANLSTCLYELSALDGVQKTTVCVKVTERGVDQYVIYDFKGTRFYAQMKTNE